MMVPTKPRQSDRRALIVATRNGFRPRQHYSKKFWWKVEQDRKEFPWGGSILDKASWAVYRVVEGALSLFGKEE
jgi:hypothetical protein